jgi:hypothetical protein
MLESAAALDTVAHIIQVALTPIFLLSGIATLLNVFSVRLGRVSDHVDDLVAASARAGATSAAVDLQLAILRRRSLVLDAAAVASALAGIATCAATLTLFVGALRDRTTETALFLLFGGAVVFTTISLALFVIEMLMAGRGLRAESRSRAPGAGA